MIVPHSFLSDVKSPEIQFLLFKVRNNYQRTAQVFYHQNIILLMIKIVKLFAPSYGFSIYFNLAITTWLVL